MGRSFADWLVESGLPENRFLEEMDRVIPWSRIEELLNREIPNPGGGRPPYPFAILFRMTLLQWWHGLSDAQTEFQCADRLTFRKFLGLGLMDRVPDSTTLEEFRHKLEARNLQARLLAELDSLFVEKGLILREGTLVDATFVKASRPKADPDRKIGKKGNGYSASVSVSRKSKLVRKVMTTDASVHDSRPLASVLPKHPGKTYVDLGYWGKPCANTISEASGTPCIPYKKPNGKKLEPWQKGLNRILSKIRSGVEHVFARWKTDFRMRNSRYCGLKKVHGYCCGMAVAFNLHRLGFLLRSKPAWSWA